MNLKLSRRDIRFLENTYFHHGFLGFMPCFAFKDGNIVEVSRMRLISFSAIIFFGAAQLFCFYPVLKYHYPLFLGSQKILSITAAITNLILYVLCFINNCFCRRRQWRRMMYLFSRTDVVLGNVNRVDGNIFTNSNVQFLVWHVFFLFLLVLRAVNYKNMKLALVITHCMNILGFYYHQAASIFISNLGLAIRCRFKDARALLTEELRVIKCPKDSKWRMKKMIKKIKIVFEANDEIIRIFNGVTGCQILVIVVRTIVSILMFVDGLITNSLKLSNRITLISVCLLMIMSMFNTLVIIYSCHSATMEGEKLYYSSKNLEKKFYPHSYEGRELKFLSMQLEYRTVFTAAGFFNINSRTLLSIIGIISTYLIIIIQLNNGILMSPIPGT